MRKIVCPHCNRWLVKVRARDGALEFTEVREGVKVYPDTPPTTDNVTPAATASLPPSPKRNNDVSSWNTGVDYFELDDATQRAQVRAFAQFHGPFRCALIGCPCRDVSDVKVWIGSDRRNVKVTISRS